MSRIVRKPKALNGNGYLIINRLALFPFFSKTSHRVTTPITDREAFLALMKCICGTGCLAMPKVFSGVGWLAGLIVTLVFGLILVHAVHVLLYDKITLIESYNVPMLSYSETIELAVLHGPTYFQPLSKLLAYQVDIFLSISYFGITCVYVNFIANNLKTLGDIYMIPIDVRIYMAVLIFPLLLWFVLSKVEMMLKTSIISTCLILISFIVVLHYMCNDLPNLLEEREAFRDWQKVPLFFGTLIFALESLGVIVSVHVDMMNPDHYLGYFGIFTRAQGLVILFYLILGFMGYWKYGDETLGSVLNNLPSEEIVPQCVIVMFSIGIFLSFSLSGYVTIEIIWNGYLDPPPSEDEASEGVSFSLEYLVRMAMVLASVLCAIAFPNFELLLAIVGFLFLSQLYLIFPAIINICIWYNKGYGPLKYKLWRSMFLILVGLLTTISGCMYSLNEWLDTETE